MERTLITNGVIVTVDPDLGILDGGDLLIEDGRIAAIGHHLDAADARRIDATGMIVMPGLINAHIHTWETVFRGIGADWINHEYFEYFLGELAEQFTPDDIYISTLMGCLNQIDGGCTTVFDWLHNTHSPDHTDMAIAALEESGVRAVFGHGTPKPSPKPGEPHFSTIPHPAHEIERLRKGRFASDDGLLSLAMCILGPDYSPLEVNRHDFLLAREYDLLTSAHVWGGPKRLTPNGYFTLVEEGLLDAKHTAVHANYFEDDEVRLLVDHGCSFTATSSIEAGLPRPPLISKVIVAGGYPSIAIDTEIEITGSMFEVMRASIQLQRAFDAVDAAAVTARGERQPANSDKLSRPDIDSTSVSGKPLSRWMDVLEWATINNARAMNLDHVTGSLTPGKQADIVLLRATDLNMLPAFDPVQAIVVHANQSNVDTVLIGGRVVKADGRMLYPAQALTDNGVQLVDASRRLMGEAGDNLSMDQLVGMD